MSTKRGASTSPQQHTLFATARWLETELSSQGYQQIIGVDEAGRGPLAGPVVAAAALLPVGIEIEELDDSKRLTEAQRDALFVHIHEVALAIGVGVICSAEIDQLNILQATKKAMAMAVDSVLRLAPLPAPDLVLIDGNQHIPHPLQQMTVVKGDQRCKTVAAASVVAKVTRDRLMMAYHDLYPQYHFATHKGYPTPLHKQALESHGPCPIHRLTFRGVLRDDAALSDASQEESE